MPGTWHLIPQLQGLPNETIGLGGVAQSLMDAGQVDPAVRHLRMIATQNASFQRASLLKQVPGFGTASGRSHPSFATDSRTHKVTAHSFIGTPHLLNHSNRRTYIKAILYLTLRWVKILMGAAGRFFRPINGAEA